MLDGHFDYGNGFHGRVYLNPHQLFRQPSTIWRFAQDLLDIIPGDLLASTEIVAGPVTGGALLAHTMAGLLDGRRSLTHPPSQFAPFTVHPRHRFVLRPFYARQMAGRRVMLADDVRNTGKTFERCAALVAEAGGTGDRDGPDLRPSRGGRRPRRPELRAGRLPRCRELPGRRSVPCAGPVSPSPRSEPSDARAPHIGPSGAPAPAGSRPPAGARPSLRRLQPRRLGPGPRARGAPLSRSRRPRGGRAARGGARLRARGRRARVDRERARADGRQSPRHTCARFDPRADGVALAGLGAPLGLGPGPGGVLWTIAADARAARGRSSDSSWGGSTPAAPTWRPRSSRSAAGARARRDRAPTAAGPRAPGCGLFFPRPSTGSACKRLNLYLRWMVRRDEIDMGVWAGVAPARLVVPLDTHVIRVGRAWA